MPQARAGATVLYDHALTGLVYRQSDPKGALLVAHQVEQHKNLVCPISPLGPGYSNFEHNFSWLAHHEPDNMRANIIVQLTQN